MSRVAVIAALADELRTLVHGWPRESRNGVELWRRRSGGSEWIAACAGVGVEAAARAFAEIERDGAVDSVVSAGWAGALSGEYAAGRAYSVSGVIDARTGERFRTAARSGECWLVTTAGIADQAEKRRLAAAYGAGLVDMEAAGVARLAGVRGIAFHCIKGVSDGLEDRIPDLNGFISPDGRFQMGRFIRSAILRPWQWPSLIRIGGNSRRAARAVGESLLHLLDEPGTFRRHNGPPYPES
jgi:adenosylhomocysteine nucleosidase